MKRKMLKELYIDFLIDNIQFVKVLLNVDTLISTLVLDYNMYTLRV